jgi:hypothetical protein
MSNTVAIDAAAFSGMREEWNLLLGRSGRSAPMLSWEWAFTWWEVYRTAGVERELKLIGVRDGAGELIGIAPFVKRPCRSSGVMFRRLEFLGTGEREEDETCSEFLDIIAAQGREVEVARAVADHLLADQGWEEIVCRDVRSDEPSVAARLTSIMAEMNNAHAEEFAAARCPFVRLPESWDGYLATLSRNSRRIVRYKRKQIESAGGAQFSTAATPEEINKAFSGFVRLHQERWQQGGEEGCFRSEYFSAFMARLTPLLAARGGVRIAQLTLGGEMAASYYLLLQGGAAYYYNSGVAIEAQGELSPGSVCLGYAIEDAIRRGEREFHFLKGGADSYKWHWTDQFVPVVSLLIRRKGWKHTAAKAGLRVRGWMRAGRQLARRGGA